MGYTWTKMGRDDTERQSIRGDLEKKEDDLLT